MPLSLTTFPAGSVISATVVRSRLATIESYVNEGIVAGDRGTNWMDANHVYRPDFFGSPDPHTTLVSGETYFRSRGQGDADRAFFSYWLNTDIFVPVPGIGATIQLPERLDQGAYDYRVSVFASFYVYEFGGIDAPMDEISYHAADFEIMVDGNNYAATKRTLYNGSQTSTNQTVAFYPRKQITIAQAWSATQPAPMTPGVHSFGIGVRNYAPGSGEWKHVIAQQGAFLVRYYLR